MKAGDVTTALRPVRRPRPLPPARRPVGPLGHAHHFGWGLRQFGRPEEGAHVLEEAIDVAASAGLWNTVQWAHADPAVAKVHVGDPATARDLFDRAAGVAGGG